MFPYLTVYFLFALCFIFAYQFMKAALYGDYNTGFSIVLFLVTVVLVCQGIYFLKLATIDPFTF